jgi:hypothetical protein
MIDVAQALDILAIREASLAHRNPLLPLRESKLKVIGLCVAIQ